MLLPGTAVSVVRHLLAGVLLSSALESAVAQAGPPPICAPPGTRSGSITTVRPYDDPLWQSKEPATVVGEIWNIDGHPIGQARVRLLGPLPKESEVAIAATQADGRFTFRRIPHGQYVLEVLRIGYQRQLHDVDLIPAGTDTICIRLRSASRMGPPVRTGSSGNTPAG